MRKIKRQSRSKEVVPIEVIEKTLQKEGFEKSLEKKVKALDKKIEKTDKLIEKAKKPAKTKHKPCKTLNTPSTNPALPLHKTKAPASLTMMDYHLLNRLPKSIMKHIIEKFEERINKDDELVFIDTFELKVITNKTASHISNTMQTLVKKGFFEIVLSKSNGMRAVKLNQDILKM